MKVSYECNDCGHVTTVSKRKAKYMDGLPCSKCNGRVIPKSNNRDQNHNHWTVAMCWCFIILCY